jgi:hypothetical protein
MTALLLCVLAFESASSATWGFKFAYGLSLLVGYGGNTNTGIVVGGVHLGWLHYIGWRLMNWAAWTVGGFTGHSFACFFSLSLARELQYPPYVKAAFRCLAMLIYILFFYSRLRRLSPI